MKEIDRELELRVWQRVRGEQQMPSLGWQELVRQELASARELGFLAGRFRGKNRALLLKCAEQEHRHGRLLARRLGMAQPGDGVSNRRASGVLEGLEAVTGLLLGRAEQYSNNAVRYPEDEMLKMLAKEERQTYGQIMTLIGQLRR